MDGGVGIDVHYVIVVWSRRVLDGRTPGEHIGDRSVGFRLQVPDCGMREVECGLQDAGCGKGKRKSDVGREKGDDRDT